MKLTYQQKIIELNWGDFWQAKAGPELYRDTAAKDILALIDQINRGTPWREAVNRRFAKENPWLNAIVTSPKRDLFFQLHPPEPGSLILDVGAGWGQTTLPLAKSNRVICIEPTPERIAFIQAAARQEGVASNIIFLQTDFFEVEVMEQLDLIACIGVLEWLPKFRQGNPRDVQLEFLRRCRQKLKPNGKLIIGIENRLGLKYLLGSNDDHIGLPNVAVLDAQLATKRYREKTGKELRSFTYSLAEYAEMTKTAGFGSFNASGAFPDYKLPQSILSLDKNFEQEVASGDCLAPEHDGASGSALAEPIQQNLRSHYQSLARLGVAKNFAPSYFLEVST